MKKRFFLGCIIVVLCLGLSGCKSSDYNNAVKLQDAGEYSSAVPIYAELGNYKDAASRRTDCETMIKAINDYDAAKNSVKNKNEELDSTIADAEALIAEGKKVLDKTFIKSLETAVSLTKAAKLDISDMPDELDEIAATTIELVEIDYTDVLANLSENRTNLENNIRQYALVDAPSEAYIIECLTEVPNVIDIFAATEDNDPNGQMNKERGYTAQVYFSSDLIDQRSVKGGTVIEKGTDCGGSIEVYSSVEDAERRNTYLSSFDGGISASGSHIVIGTVLVRTSNELKASQQKELEVNIIMALTSLDD